MPKEFFDLAADALRGFMPREFRGFSTRVGGHNLKVWFGEEGAEHYEIQTLSRAALKAGGIKSAGPALEIGFHAEHALAQANEDVLGLLLNEEKAWRKALGKEPSAGRFAGRQAAWRRLSEIWEVPELFADETAIEAADRLTAYVRTFEPLRARR